MISYSLHDFGTTPTPLPNFPLPPLPASATQNSQNAPHNNGGVLSDAEIQMIEDAILNSFGCLGSEGLEDGVDYEIIEVYTVVVDAGILCSLEGHWLEHV